MSLLETLFIRERRVDLSAVSLVEIKGVSDLVLGQAMVLGDFHLGELPAVNGDDDCLNADPSVPKHRDRPPGSASLIRHLRKSRVILCHAQSSQGEV